MISVNKSSIEYGDYQTPVSFVARVCEKLSSFYDLNPNIVFEPTFGKGSFLDGIMTVFSEVHTIYGVEINSNYYEIAKSKIENITTKNVDVQLFNEDIFTFDFNKLKGNINREDSLLVIGNPPWVTNSQLAAMGSTNLPQKSNYRKYSGLDAMTGKGNFDIAEYIVLMLLCEFANYNCTIAMLCKTIVAKNIMRDAKHYPFSIASMDLFTFDANEVFGANCDAGLLVVRLGDTPKETCSVYDFDSDDYIREFGWHDNYFYANMQNLGNSININGNCQFEWRQGIKHDCSKVMELVVEDSGSFRNGFGDIHDFDVGRFLYPIIKSSDIKSHTISQTRKYVIISQKRINENTDHIEVEDPLIWEYLQKHETFLSARKSSIYKNSPKYSIFGIGDYSFSKYKVGISGFYKEPLFTLAMGEIPIMMDDTCYFLSFDDVSSAAITLAMLNHPICNSFLKAIAFLDSKRPYTKEILQRIDLGKLSEFVDFQYINDYIGSQPIECSLTETDYISYCLSLKAAQLALF